ncbi:MAG: ribosomal protein S18-alanine N-acetyltransferase [Eubacteriales bacterium]
MERFYLRPADKDDIMNMAALDSACFAIPWSLDSFENELENVNTTYVVVCDGDEIVGFAGFWKIANEGHITRVMISKDYRRQALGKVMLEFLMMLGKDMGVSEYTLEMRRSNEPALKFYEKLGFAVEGIRPKYYQNNMEDALVLWKRSGK